MARIDPSCQMSIGAARGEIIIGPQSEHQKMLRNNKSNTMLFNSYTLLILC